MPDMVYDSFQFGSYNSVTDWGIRVVKYDTLMPPKRSRKRSIPLRHGQYDYGAQNYEERAVRISCVLEKQIARAELREIAYQLSRKAQLRLWDEPDKYYVGEIYDAAEIEDYFEETMREFTLTFICEPFAYADAKTVALADGENAAGYSGTVARGCVIEICNPNDFDVSNITIITQTRR